MARRKQQAKNYNIADMQPDELNELKRLAREYISRLDNIENEIALLQEDRKALKEEFEDRLDVRTLAQVIRVLKLEASVTHKDTYDTFYEALKEDQPEEP